jgi:hypothetical protein
MKLIHNLKKDYGKDKVEITATTHWKEDYRKLKLVSKKGAKKMTVEVEVHWGNFLKFIELVWRMGRKHIEMPE